MTGNEFNNDAVARFKNKFKTGQPQNSTAPIPQPPLPPQQTPQQTPAPTGFNVAPQHPAQPPIPQPAQPQPGFNPQPPPQSGPIPQVPVGYAQAPQPTNVYQSPRPTPQPAPTSLPTQPYTTIPPEKKRSKAPTILAFVGAAVLVAALAVGGTYIFMKNRNNGGDVLADQQQTPAANQPQGTENVAQPDQNQPTAPGGTDPNNADSGNTNNQDPNSATNPDTNGQNGTDSGSGTSANNPVDGGGNNTNSPGEQLQAQIEADQRFVDYDVIGYWVPQVSSKRVGMKADGKTWTEQAILDEHKQLRELYPDALLIKSDDYPSFKEKGFYVTIIDAPNPTADGALRWCIVNGLDGDHCYAKFISTSGGSDGTTRLQH